MDYEKMQDLVKCSLYIVNQKTGDFEPNPAYCKPDAITYVMMPDGKFIPKSEIAQ